MFASADSDFRNTSFTVYCTAVAEVITYQQSLAVCDDNDQCSQKRVFVFIAHHHCFVAILQASLPSTHVKMDVVSVQPYPILGISSHIHILLDIFLGPQAPYPVISRHYQYSLDSHRSPFIHTDYRDRAPNTRLWRRNGSITESLRR